MNKHNFDLAFGNFEGFFFTQLCLMVMSDVWVVRCFRTKQKCVRFLVVVVDLLDSLGTGMHAKSVVVCGL